MVPGGLLPYRIFQASLTVYYSVPLMLLSCFRVFFGFLVAVFLLYLCLFKHKYGCAQHQYLIYSFYVEFVFGFCDSCFLDGCT